MYHRGSAHDCTTSRKMMSTTLQKSQNVVACSRVCWSWKCTSIFSPIQRISKASIHCLLHSILASVCSPKNVYSIFVFPCGTSSDKIGGEMNVRRAKKSTRKNLPVAAFSMANVWIGNPMFGTYQRTNGQCAAFFVLYVFRLEFRSGCYSGQNECIRENGKQSQRYVNANSGRLRAHTFPVVRDATSSMWYNFRLMFRCFAIAFLVRNSFWI